MTIRLGALKLGLQVGMQVVFVLGKYLPPNIVDFTKNWIVMGVACSAIHRLA